MLTFPVECVVFDCDGVLLQSLDIKIRAFARLAQPFGAEARDMLLYFHARHEIGRASCRERV